MFFGDVAQLARAFGSYPKGRGFDPLRRYHLKITNSYRVSFFDFMIKISIIVFTKRGDIMEVKDKLMLHFNHSDMYPDIWVPGNELTIDENYNSDSCNRLQEKEESVISNYIESLKDTSDSLEKYKVAMEALKEGRYLLPEIFQREVALEILRRLEFPELPSRKRSIFLCDENSARHWKSSLKMDGKSLDLYLVSVSGILFKSSDSFIPLGYGNLETSIEEARQYWNPKFERRVEENQAEYLFQGKLKILKRINKTN